MSYTPTTWVDDSLPAISAANLNHLETGLQTAAATADTASTTATSASALAASALPTPAGSNGQFLKRVGGVWVPTTFLASDIPSYPSDVTQVLRGDGTWAKPPGYQFDYAEATANVTITGTTSGSPTAIVSGAAVTYDGATAVIATFYAPAVTIIAGHTVNIGLYEDGTLRSVISGPLVNNTASNLQWPVGVNQFRFTPASGSRTYTVKAWTSASSADAIIANTGASGNPCPAFLRVEKA